jgi:hypothetical protein
MRVPVASGSRLLRQGWRGDAEAAAGKGKAGKGS